MNITPQEFPARIWAMLTDHLPRLFGTGVVSNSLATAGIRGSCGRSTITLLAAGARGRYLAATIWWKSRRAGVPSRAVPTPRMDFPIFLLGVGLTAVATYIATRPADRFVARYLLLSLYIPIGIMALLFVVERRTGIRRAAALVVLTVAVGSGVDHVRQFGRTGAASNRTTCAHWRRRSSIGTSRSRWRIIGAHTS